METRLYLIVYHIILTYLQHSYSKNVYLNLCLHFNSIHWKAEHLNAYFNVIYSHKFICKERYMYCKACLNSLKVFDVRLSQTLLRDVVVLSFRIYMINQCSLSSLSFSTEVDNNQTSPILNMGQLAIVMEMMQFYKQLFY